MEKEQTTFRAKRPTFAQSLRTSLCAALNPRRSRAIAYTRIRLFSTFVFTSPPSFCKVLYDCTLGVKKKAVDCLHLLLHSPKTEGEREQKSTFSKTNTTNLNPNDRKGEGNFADCLHPYSIHAQEDKPIR